MGMVGIAMDLRLQLHAHSRQDEMLTKVHAFTSI